MSWENMEKSNYMKLRIKSYRASLLLIFITCTSTAQIIPLDTVLARVDKQNPTLQVYDEKVNALRAYSERAGAWMAPMVGAGTFMTPYAGQKISESRDRGFLMVSVEQSIPNPGRLNAEKKYLNSKSAVASEGRAVVFNELRADARMAYYQWIILEKRKQLLRQGKTIVAFMLNTAQIRYPHNQGPLSAIYKAEGRLSEIDNSLLSVQAGIDEQKYTLMTLMNMSSAASWQPDTTVLLPFEGIDIAKDTIALTENRSDIQQVRRSIDVLHFDQQRQRAQAKPDFKLRFDHMSPLGNGMPSQFTAMGMVSIPIVPWASKMYKAEVKGIEFDIRAMQRDEDAIVNRVKGRLSFLFSQITLTQQQLDNYERKIIPALQKNYNAILLAYGDNRAQLPDVLDAWEASNAAELAWLEKKESYYTLVVTYEKELEK